MDTHKTFFIADDDEDDIFFFSEAMKEVDNSIKILVARDGEEAISMLMNSEIKMHYIFLDLNMPKKNGRECLTEIRKEYRFKDVPVVIYTTSSSENDKEELLSLGADYFITKYKSFEELRDKLTSLLQEKN